MLRLRLSVEITREAAESVGESLGGFIAITVGKC